MANLGVRKSLAEVQTEGDRLVSTGWDVTLHCNRCSLNIGRVLNVVTCSASAEFDQSSFQALRNAMREHEVEKHGGKS